MIVEGLVFHLVGGNVERDAVRRYALRRVNHVRDNRPRLDIALPIAAPAYVLGEAVLELANRSQRSTTRAGDATS